MSAFGSIADIAAALPNVRSTPKADITENRRDVRFVPKADLGSRKTLVDHFVSDGPQTCRNDKTQRLRCFKIEG